MVDVLVESPGLASRVSVAEGRRASASRLRPANLGEEALQLLRVDRLDEVPVEAGLGRPTPIGLLAPAGQRHEEGSLEPGPGPQPPGHLVAVHLRHADVEQDHLGPEFLGRFQGRGAVVGDAHLLAVEPRQQPGQAVRRIGVVVHDQDASAPDLRPAPRSSSITRVDVRLGREGGQPDDELAARCRGRRCGP